MIEPATGHEAPAPIVSRFEFGSVQTRAGDILVLLVLDADEAQGRHEVADRDRHARNDRNVVDGAHRDGVEKSSISLLNTDALP